MHKFGQPGRVFGMALGLLWGAAAYAQTSPNQSEPKSLALPSLQSAPAAPATPEAQVRAAYDAAFQQSMDKPSDPEVLAKFAELAVQVGDIEGAISALDRLLLINADQPDVKLELGVLYYRLGSIEAARTYLEGARTSSQASNETKERAAIFLKAAAAK